MNKSVISLTILLTLTGCLHSLQYDLTDQDKIKPLTNHSMNVVVLKFDDVRPREERTDSIREQLGQQHISDYTYDKEFNTKVNNGISTMFTEHLNEVGVFMAVKYIPTSFTEMEPRTFDSLHRIGVDAVVTGRIHNFFGYYQTDAGSILIPTAFMLGLGLPPLFLMSHNQEKTYTFLGETFTMTEFDKTPILVSQVTMALGTWIGLTIEGMRERDIEYKTKLSLRLVSTKSRITLWEDSIIVEEKRHKSAPGTNKFDLAIESFHEATRKLVNGLLLASFTPESISPDSVSDKYTPNSRVMLSKKPEPTIPPSVEISYDSIVTMMDEQVQIRCSSKSDKLILSFKGIIGIDRNMTGSFNETSLEVQKNNTFYVLINSTLLLRVDVAQATGDGISLIFTKY